MAGSLTRVGVVPAIEVQVARPCCISSQTALNSDLIKKNKNKVDLTYWYYQGFLFYWYY